MWSSYNFVPALLLALSLLSGCLGESDSDPLGTQWDSDSVEACLTLAV